MYIQLFFTHPSVPMLDISMDSRRKSITCWTRCIDGSASKWFTKTIALWYARMEADKCRGTTVGLEEVLCVDVPCMPILLICNLIVSTHRIGSCNAKRHTFPNKKWSVSKPLPSFLKFNCRQCLVRVVNSSIGWVYLIKTREFSYILNDGMNDALILASYRMRTEDGELVHSDC